MTDYFEKAAVPQPAGRGLVFLYGNAFGRIILRILRAKWISVTAGAFLSTPLSKPLIKPFLRNNGINLDDYEKTSFKSFNDCFTRKIRKELRPFDSDKGALCAPCDGLLSVYKIEKGAVLTLKQCPYTISSLLKNEKTASEYENGYAYVFRLCVDNYHRYSYPADGIKKAPVRIKGTLHTVRPVALEKYRVFCENSREYTEIETEKFGKIIQAEIGALFVGKIKNDPSEGKCGKGAEKGMFLYGGSTVVLLANNENALPCPVLLENTGKGLETPVKMGMRINAE